MAGWLSNPQFLGNGLGALGAGLLTLGAPTQQRAQVGQQAVGNFQQMIAQQQAQRERDFLLNRQISEEARQYERQAKADKEAADQKARLDMFTKDPANAKYAPFINAFGAGAVAPEILAQAFPKAADQPTSVEEFNFAQGNPAYADWLSQQANLKKPTTNINMPSPLSPDQIGQSKFAELAAKSNVDLFNSAIVGGQNANKSLGDIKMLGALVKSQPTGAGQPIVNAISSYAKRLGVDTSDVANLPAAQQMQAIVARIVPTLRPPGSGTTSDRDLALFQESLPSLVNTPEGNMAIVANLEKIAKRNLQEAAIADQALSGSITPSEARKQILDLGPMDLSIPRVSYPTGGNNFPRNEPGKVLTYNPATGKLE